MLEKDVPEINRVISSEEKPKTLRGEYSDIIIFPNNQTNRYD